MLMTIQLYRTCSGDLKKGQVTRRNRGSTSRLPSSVCLVICTTACSAHGSLVCCKDQLVQRAC